ncbi:MAG: L,D-transpeptidase family protein [Chthoniobacterales bacterium]
MLGIVPITASGAEIENNSKHVVIDKTRQELFAYEGNRLVFETHISTGKWNQSTPTGHFIAGEKSLMHYSKKYHNSPMPFSIYVTGNVFIHGYKNVPNYPASHGCIRLPLIAGQKNPAKILFDWIKPGTKIDIIGAWIDVRNTHLSISNDKSEAKLLPVILRLQVGNKLLTGV